MALVLGIDAAWTDKKCSGVALLEVGPLGRRLIRAAPSFAAFIAHADGALINWDSSGSPKADVGLLLQAARSLGCGDINLVAVDMPLSRKLIEGRREADDAVSREFGGKGAAVHSPSKGRPGEFGRSLHAAFEKQGFRLATTLDGARKGPRLIEVFPLAALVALMQTERAEDRPCYKVGKTAAYWRRQSPTLDERKRLLAVEWAAIIDFLKGDIADFDFSHPDLCSAPSFAALKPYEDALDAIICALVGAYVLEDRAHCYGDGDAVIFVPRGAAQTATFPIGETSIA